MRIFKAKAFARWARKEGLGDAELRRGIAEIEAGLVEADLGAGLVKKRLARPGRGKRAGFRTIVAARSGRRAFFLYGVAKNERDNITGQELAALKRLATELMSYSDRDLSHALADEALTEIDDDDDET